MAKDGLSHFDPSTVACKRSCERRPQRVQVGHAAAFIFRLYPSRFEVCATLPVRDWLHEDNASDSPGWFDAREAGPEPLVHRDYINPLRLAFRDGDGAGVEIYIFPFETLKITPTQPGEQSTEVPRQTLGTAPCRYSNQALDLVCAERSTDVPAIPIDLPLGQDLQIVARHTPPLHAPVREGEGDLTSHVDGSRRTVLLIEMLEVLRHTLGLEIAECAQATDADRVRQVTLFVLDVLDGVLGPPAVVEVILDVCPNWHLHRISDPCFSRTQHPGADLLPVKLKRSRHPLRRPLVGRP